jgi:hypothetical protein
MNHWKKGKKKKKSKSKSLLSHCTSVYPGDDGEGKEGGGNNVVCTVWFVGCE